MVIGSVAHACVGKTSGGPHATVRCILDNFTSLHFIYPAVHDVMTLS